MEIEKFKKLTGGKYKIITNNEEIIIYEDVIIKYNLLAHKELNIDLLGKILQENEYFEIYNSAIKYIEIKMRNKKELIAYLEKKTNNNEIINKTIKKLEELGLINEKKYVTAFINDKINLTLTGPYKIKAELMKNNIIESTIDEYLNTFDNSLWIKRINEIINKKIKLNKNKSSYALKNKIYNDLIYLGYEKELIMEVLNTKKIVDTETIRKEYDKIYRRLSNKYSADELKYRIKNELYKKGFNINDLDEFYE